MTSSISTTEFMSVLGFEHNELELNRRAKMSRRQTRESIRGVTRLYRRFIIGAGSGHHDDVLSRIDGISDRFWHAVCGSSSPPALYFNYRR